MHDISRDINRCLSSFPALSAAGIFSTLAKIYRGLEKECLRVDAEHHLSQKPHPPALGASLCHSAITTDFSEALLEFITAPSLSINSNLQQLREIHQFTQMALAPHHEALWPSSMPCRLPTDQEIPIAHYGPSNLGRLKEIYRQGLGLRYGRKMQTIAGIHYNFSFSSEFWNHYHSYCQSQAPLASFVSEQYFALIRNVLRWRWLLPLWFGASPALDASFLDHPEALSSPIPELKLTPWETPHPTWMSPYATSLRLSDLGYSNTRSHQAIPMSFNSLSDFVRRMTQAVSTPYPPFEKKGVISNQQYLQLNANALQIENEYYGIIRPKRALKQGQRLLPALAQQGVEYLEVRALDLNPFEPLGVNPSNLRLLDVFLSSCLLLPSPPLTETELALSQRRYQAMVVSGRQPGLLLASNTDHKIAPVDLAQPLIAVMTAVAEQFDALGEHSEHAQAVTEASQQLQHPELSPSGQVYAMMAQSQASHLSFNLHQMQQHQTAFSSFTLTAEQQAQWQALAQTSLQDFQELEQTSEPSFEVFLKQYLDLNPEIH